METTFYDDSQFRVVKSDGNKGTKRPATLDWKSPGTVSKKKKFAACILTSPDLNMLKLPSPEMEKLIMANAANMSMVGLGLNITTTPTPTQLLFPKSVTEEQEQFSKGFLDALSNMHQPSLGSFLSHSETSIMNPVSNAALSKLYSGMLPIYLHPGTVTSVIKTPIKGNVPTTVAALMPYRPPSVENTSSNSCHSSSLPLSVDMSIKEELQTVPSDFSTPPLSPVYKSIDMEEQERIKLDRKRHRNRIAATKCRKKKLEKISTLEDKVQDLKNQNSELGRAAEKLREQVLKLKQQILEHANYGCQIMITHGL